MTCSNTSHVVFGFAASVSRWWKHSAQIIQRISTFAFSVDMALERERHSSLLQ